MRALDGQNQDRPTSHYTFATLSDDGARLWVNNKPLVEDWTYHPPKRVAGAIDLPAGTHELKLEYFNGDGNACCKLFWALKDGFAEELVPAEVLQHTPSAAETPASA